MVERSWVGFGIGVGLGSVWVGTGWVDAVAVVVAAADVVADCVVAAADVDLYAGLIAVARQARQAGRGTARRTSCAARSQIVMVTIMAVMMMMMVTSEI